VGYHIKLDASGKDAYNKDTYNKDTYNKDTYNKDTYNKDTLGDQGVNITWRFNDPSLVEEGGTHAWQPKLEVKKAGYFTATATFDGKVSNRLELEFVAK
jgi:hypothetical protein